MGFIDHFQEEVAFKLNKDEWGKNWDKGIQPELLNNSMEQNESELIILKSRGGKEKTWTISVSMGMEVQGKSQAIQGHLE